MNKKIKIYSMIGMLIFTIVGSWLKSITTVVVSYGVCHYLFVTFISHIFKSEIPGYSKFMIMDYLLDTNLLIMVGGVLPIYIFSNEIEFLILRILATAWIAYMIKINVRFIKEKKYIEIYSTPLIKN